MTVQSQEVAAGDDTASRWLVPVLTLGVTVNILSARALAVFLPVVAADLDTSVALLGQVPSLMLLLAGLLALVAGPLADRYGFRRMLVIGLVSVTVSAVATGLSPNLPILLAVTLVGAVARASVLPTAQAVVVTAFADEDARRKAIGWVTSGLSTAAIVGIPLMTSIAGYSSWRWSFFVMGLLALVAAVFLQRALPNDSPTVSGPLHVREILGSYKPLQRHRPTLLIILATLISDTGLWCAMTYYAAFLVQRHGFSIDDVGWVFLAIGVLAFGGNMFAGGRVGTAPRALLLVCRTVSAVCLCAAMTVPMPWQATVAVVLIAAPTFAMGDIATTLLLTLVSPAGRATTLTLRSAAVCVGTASGGVLGGILLAVGGYGANGIAALVLLLASVVFVWMARAEQAPVPRPVTS